MNHPTKLRKFDAAVSRNKGCDSMLLANSKQCVEFLLRDVFARNSTSYDRNTFMLSNDKVPHFRVLLAEVSCCYGNTLVQGSE